jgi:hypothetical protein
VSNPNSPRPDFLPVIVLFAIVGIICAGIWLFPHFQKIIQQQDCVAVGRNDCN